MKLKRFILSVSLLLLVNFFVFADYVGKVYVVSANNINTRKQFLPVNKAYKDLFDMEIQMGNLVKSKIQVDSIGHMEHHRYFQQHKNLPVFGGEIIYHIKNGIVKYISGEYYRIGHIDVQPNLTIDEAVEIFRGHLSEEDLIEKPEDSKLIIYPVNDNQFRLAYQLTLEKGGYYSMTGIIDAKTGEILFEYSNIHFDDAAIGQGVDYHGYMLKMATTLSSDGYYYLFDEKRVRPYNQYTLDDRGGYIPGDADNYWDFDGAIVNAHVFVGFIYDFYYKFFDRKGIDNNNLDTIVHANNTELTDNAFWSGESLNFCFPGKGNNQTAAALDIVGHEYSHGVKQYSSNLVYAFEPGALNESFSDIMGTTAEFYLYPEGNGLYMADWYIGEDAAPYYSISGCRNLADPNTNSQMGDSRYPDPCHLSQKYEVPYELDSGGVHLNATIYAHAFYLLANGGVNRVSNVYVNGIGIDKAAAIYYRAFVYYMTKNSWFIDAANALLDTAYSIYGGNSNEYMQTVRSMEAIGWIVN